MSAVIVPIVEGHGEEAALPVLLRRIAQWKTPDVYVDVRHPIRVHKDRFLNKPEEFRRYLSLAAVKGGDEGRLLILVDADDDCPAARGAEILAKAQAHIAGRLISVVMAKREYEAWFIASAQSLHGVRGFCFDPRKAVDAETPRDAKGWLASQMEGRCYGEVLDQPALSARMDLQQAYDGSRSFRKLCDDWVRMFS